MLSKERTSKFQKCVCKHKALSVRLLVNQQCHANLKHSGRTYSIQIFILQKIFPSISSWMTETHIVWWVWCIKIKSLIRCPLWSQIQNFHYVLNTVCHIMEQRPVKSVLFVFIPERCNNVHFFSDWENAYTWTDRHLVSDPVEHFRYSYR